MADASAAAEEAAIGGVTGRDGVRAHGERRSGERCLTSAQPDGRARSSVQGESHRSGRRPAGTGNRGCEGDRLTDGAGVLRRLHGRRGRRIHRLIDRTRTGVEIGVAAVAGLNIVCADRKRRGREKCLAIDERDRAKRLAGGRIGEGDGTGGRAAVGAGDRNCERDWLAKVARVLRRHQTGAGVGFVDGLSERGRAAAVESAVAAVAGLDIMAAGRKR